MTLTNGLDDLLILWCSSVGHKLQTGEVCDLGLNTYRPCLTTLMKNLCTLIVGLCVNMGLWSVYSTRIHDTCKTDPFSLSTIRTALTAPGVLRVHSASTSQR